MEKNNLPSYKQTSFLILICAGIILIVYIVSLCMLFSEKEIDADNKNNAIQFTSLFITALTILFVYRTYNIQKEQIDIQRDEIKNNIQDVEFNRVLDIVYQHSNKTIKNVKDIKQKRVVLKYTQKIISDDGTKTKYDAYQYLVNKFKVIEEAYKCSVLSVVDEIYPEYLEDFNILYDLFDKELETIHQGLIIYMVLIDDNKKLAIEHKRILKLIIKDLFYFEIQKYYEVVNDNLYKLYITSIENFKYIQEYDINEPHHFLAIQMRKNKSIYENIKLNISRLDFIL